MTYRKVMEERRILAKRLNQIPGKYRDLVKCPLTGQEKEQLLRGRSILRIFQERQRKDRRK